MLVAVQDDGFDKCGLAEEAQRVAQNLAAAAAAGGFGTTPFPCERRFPAPELPSHPAASKLCIPAHVAFHVHCTSPCLLTAAAPVCVCRRPSAARTPAPNMTRPLSPGGTSLRAQLVERMASPELTDGLKDMHNQMLIKQLTAAEKKVKELEGENIRIKEQV